MVFDLVAKAPLWFWLGFALTLVVPFHLPRFGMAFGALGTAFGALLCRNDNADAFARAIAQGVGTAIVVCAGAWLVAACAGSIRIGHGATWLTAASAGRKSSG